LTRARHYFAGDYAAAAAADCRCCHGCRHFHYVAAILTLRFDFPFTFCFSTPAPSLSMLSRHIATQHASRCRFDDTLPIFSLLLRHIDFTPLPRCCFAAAA